MPAAVTYSPVAAAPPAELSSYSVGDGKGLVLGGEPFPTAWWSDVHSNEPILIRWGYAEDDDAVLTALVQAPDDIWELSGLIFTAGHEPLYLFDAACRGTEIEPTNCLVNSIAMGSYSLYTAILKPNDRVFLAVHRFSPIAGSAR